MSYWAYNAREYGATGKGWPDDDINFLDDCVTDFDVVAPSGSNRGGRIHLPALGLRGKYYISRPWEIFRPVIVDGDGAGAGNYSATRILCHGHTAIIVCSGNPTRPGGGRQAGGYSVLRDFRVVHMEEPANDRDFPAPHDQWRPGVSYPDEWIITPATIPNWFASVSAGTPPHFGIAYQADGAITSGASEPTWHYKNTRSGTGEAKAFTVDTGTNVCTSNSHGWSNGQSVRVSSTITLPTATGAGFAIETTYYVGNVTANTFKLYRDSALSQEIDFTGTGAGTHSVFTYIVIDMSPISDNGGSWNPIIAHGIDIQARVHAYRVNVYCFPGNGWNINTSSLYAQQPGVGGGGWDYSNSNLQIMQTCEGSYCGGSGFFCFGFDANASVYINCNAIDNHGYGVFDRGSLANIWIGTHCDGNEAGQYYSRGSQFVGCYSEGDIAGSVICDAARWEGGVNLNFSGCPELQGVMGGHENVRHVGAWSSSGYSGGKYQTGDFVKPTVEMGWEWLLVEISANFTVDASTNVCTANSHGFTSGQAMAAANSGGALPAAAGAGFAVGTYYIGSVTANTFKLYRDAGLTDEVDFTDTGTGTHRMWSRAGGVTGAPGAAEPTWKPCMSLYLMDKRNSAVFGTDEFKIVVDGSCKWRAWASSEVSDGYMSRSGGSSDTVFVSRYAGYQFWASGNSNTPSAFSFAAKSTLDNGGTKYDMIHDDSAKHWRFQRGGATDVFRIGAHGSTNGLAVGAMGFPNGVHIGGVSPFLRHIYRSSDPGAGSETWVRGEIVWNSAPSAGGPPGWMCVASGTPGTWKAMANLAA